MGTISLLMFEIQLRRGRDEDLPYSNWPCWSAWRASGLEVKCFTGFTHLEICQFSDFGCFHCCKSYPLVNLDRHNSIQFAPTLYEFLRSLHELIEDEK